MAVKTDFITVSSRGGREVIDLTPELRNIIGRHGLSDGIAVVFSPGSTAGITTIEYEPGLKKDIDIFLEKLVPYGGRITITRPGTMTTGRPTCRRP